MSLQVEMNPEEIDGEYLECLNTCFPRWGDKPVSDWVFHRQLNPDPLPDRFVLRDDEALLAGSAVSYRSVLLPNGSVVRAGIMTGSWTLPAARGRGCFSRVIEESVSVTRKRDGAILLAFVTEENPSCRQLQKAGAALFPTSYLITDTIPRMDDVEDASRELTPEGAGDTFRDSLPSWAAQRKKRCTFSYSSFEAWSRQFVERPWETQVMRDGTGSFAVLEKHATTDRINAVWDSSEERTGMLLNGLLAGAASEGRKLFAFSTDAGFSARCMKMGFAERPGFLTAMVTDCQRLARALELPPPTGEFSSRLLAEPSSPWFLGGWDLQSGDRM